MNLLIKLLTGHLNKEMNENETEIYTSGANLFRNIESVGGKLILTNERLIFLPRSININQDKEYVELSRINSMEKVKTLGIIENGLLVTLNNDKKLQFVVNNREKWIEKISETKLAID